MSFYSNVFDSKLVLAQIAAMQVLSYFSLSLILLISRQVFRTPAFTSLIFNHHFLGGRESPPVSTNFPLIAAFLLNSFFFGIQLSFVVERAKKCLDFCTTFLFIHMLLCTFVTGFPYEWRWWMLNIACLVLSSLCGEYFCMKKELQEINVKEFLSMRNPSTRTINSTAVVAENTVSNPRRTISSNNNNISSNTSNNNNNSNINTPSSLV